MASRSTVAKEALAYCTSCKMDLNHVIVAMQGDRIARVQCRTCMKEHAYRAPKGITTPSAAPAKKPRASKKNAETGETLSNSIEVEWEKLMTAHKDAPMKTYSMKASFGLGDKLKHPSFGEGIVGKLIYPNKLEVIFQHDVKVLIHAGA